MLSKDRHLHACLAIACPPPLLPAFLLSCRLRPAGDACAGRVARCAHLLLCPHELTCLCLPASPACPPFHPAGDACAGRAAQRAHLLCPHECVHQVWAVQAGSGCVQGHAGRGTYNRTSVQTYNQPRTPNVHGSHFMGGVRATLGSVHALYGAPGCCRAAGHRQPPLVVLLSAPPAWTAA